MDAPRVADRVRLLAYFLLVLLLAWPLQTGALYHEPSRSLALWQATACLALVAAAGMRERRRFMFSPTRVAAAGLLLAYVLSTAVAAVAPREALGEVIKHGLYLTVFFVASELVAAGRGFRGANGEGPWWSRFASAESLLLGAWVAAALMGVVSLAGAFSLLPLETVSGGRLFTLMNYPNSAGPLFGAAFLAGLGLRRSGLISGRLARYLYCIGQWTCLTGLFLTMSRGAWLVFPVALALTFVLWPPGRRLAMAGEAALMGSAALLVAPFMTRVWGQPVIGAGLIGAGFLAAVLAGWLAHRFESMTARRQALIALGLLLLGGVALSGLLVSSGLSETLAARLTGFSLSERSAWERLVWTQDALRMVRDYPLLGLGGGGWAARYFQYQSYGYFTTEVHNDFAQIWVETGTIGFLAFLAFLVLSGRNVWRSARRAVSDPCSRAIVAALGGSAGMLVLHSTLDFDLTLASVGVFLWMLLGAADGLGLSAGPDDTGIAAGSRSRRRHGAESAAPVLRTWAWPLAVAALLSLTALSLALAGHLGREAMRLAKDGQTEAALRACTRACTFDPLSPRHHLRRALVLEVHARQTGAPEFLREAKEEMEAAVRLDRYNPEVHNTYGLFALRTGGLELGIAEFEEALKLQPLEASRYGQVTEGCVTVAQNLLSGGDRERARAFLERAAGVPERLAQQAAKVPDYVPERLALPDITPIVAIWAGKAEALLRHWDEASRLLTVAHEADLCLLARETGELVRMRKAEAALWLSVVEELRGRPDAAQPYLEELRAISPDVQALRQELLRFISEAQENPE